LQTSGRKKPLAVTDFVINALLYKASCPSVTRNYLQKVNSKYDCIKRYLKLRLFINDVIKNNPNHRDLRKYLLDNYEVKIAENMIAVLKPFKEMTLMLINEKLTNSHALPILFFILKTLKAKDGDTDDLLNLKSLLNESLICLAT
jgi:hypothetical protein